MFLSLCLQAGELSVPAARVLAGELAEGHVLAPQDVSLRSPSPRQRSPQHARLSQISAEARRSSPQWESLEEKREKVLNCEETT